MKGLETSRIYIKELNENDASFMFQLMNSPGWLKYIGDRTIKNETDAEKYLVANIIPSYYKHGFGLYKISLRNNSKVIGICGLLQRDYLKNPDLGFAILPDHSGHGYTHEASKAILDYAKKDLRIEIIEAITVEDNHASIGLLKKLGFQRQELITRDNEQLLLFRKYL